MGEQLYSQDSMNGLKTIFEVDVEFENIDREYRLIKLINPKRVEIAEMHKSVIGEILIQERTKIYSDKELAKGIELRCGITKEGKFEIEKLTTLKGERIKYRINIGLDWSEEGDHLEISSHSLGIVKCIGKEKEIEEFWISIKNEPEIDLENKNIKWGVNSYTSKLEKNEQTEDLFRNLIAKWEKEEIELYDEHLRPYDFDEEMKARLEKRKKTIKEEGYELYFNVDIFYNEQKKCIVINLKELIFKFEGEYSLFSSNRIVYKL